MAKRTALKFLLSKYYLTLLTVCSAVFLPLFIDPQIITTKDNDLGRTYIPLFNFFKESTLEFKQIPLWRPDQFMGEAFLGNPLSSLFYPLNAIFLILPIHFASVLYIFTHFVLAAFFTFHLARSFRLSKSSSFAAAIFYAFSMKMILHLAAGHITMIASFAFLPLLFLAVRKTLLVPKLSNNLLASVSLTFLYLTYATIFLYAFIFVALYCTYFFAHEHVKNSSKLLLRSLLALGIFILIFLGLSAVALFPHLEFASYSTRSQLTIYDVAQPLWNFKRLLVSLIFPYLNFSDLDHESFLYFGFIPSLLAIAGFVRLTRRQKIILVVFGILLLLFVAGLSTPLFQVAYDLFPPLRYTRITTRVWIIPTLLVALLAAYSLEKVRRRWLVYIALIIFLLESLLVGFKKIQGIPNLSFGNEGLYEFLSQDSELFRVYCTTYCFNPQMLAQYNIQILNGESPIQDSRVTGFLEEAGNYKHSGFAVIFPPYQMWQVANPPQPDAKKLGLANVKYIASTYPLQEDGVIFLRKYKDIFLYKNEFFKPRVYSDDGNTVISKYSPNHIVLKTQKSQQNKPVVLSELYYPGWYSYVNAQKQTIEKSPPLFRSVNIPAGADTVEIKYVPDALKLGKTITFFTLSVLILLRYIPKKRIVWPKLPF